MDKFTGQIRFHALQAFAKRHGLAMFQGTRPQIYGENIAIYYTRALDKCRVYGVGVRGLVRELGAAAIKFEEKEA